MYNAMINILTVLLIHNNLLAQFISTIRDFKGLTTIIWLMLIKKVSTDLQQGNAGDASPILCFCVFELLH